MKRDRSAVKLPLSSSWTTWMKMWEVGATAPIVIGYRLAGMARAGSEPSTRDQREFTRMGQEKVDAWYEGSLAMGQRLFEANLALTGLFWRQVWGGALSPGVFTAPLARLGPGLLTDSLSPVHRRVVANNRRLSRPR
jgi:hypothetical protein